MALVFKTPKTAINTTTRDIQNIKDGECPPCPECPECPEVKLTTADVEYTDNGSFTVTPESGFDGLSQVDITVNIDTQSIADEAYAEGEAAGIVTGKAQGVAEQKAKLTSTTLTTNGTVTREDGWNEVTVNVDTTTPYNEGVAAGIAEQKAKLTSLNVTSNGTYNKEDGYNAVTVDVQPDLETKTVTYTANDTYTIIPPAGKDGISLATVTVNVPSDVNNQDKTVSPTTSSQSVTADSGYSGLGTVTVEAVTSSIDANIAAGNIKKDVSILGVTGSYDPQPDLETKSVTYTANDTYTITPTTGKDGMSSVEVTVNVAGGGGTQCPDWSSIGWDCNDVENSSLADDIAYTAQKKAQFEAGTINNFSNDGNLKFLPKVTLCSDSSSLFSGCNAAKYVPQSFDGQPVNINYMFQRVRLAKQPEFDWSEVTTAVNAFTHTNYGEGVDFNPIVNAPKCTDMTNCFSGYSGGANSAMTTATINAPLVTNVRSLFSGNKKLATVNLTLGKLKECDYMFAKTAISTAPQLDLSECESIQQMFAGCSNITQFPNYDYSSINGTYGWSNGTTDSPFMGTSITTIPDFTVGDSTKTNAINFSFAGMSNLTTIGNVTLTTACLCVGFNNSPNVTTIGGFTNLGASFANSYNACNIYLNSLSQLTKQSILNVFNTIADRTSFPSTAKGIIYLSAAQYATLTEEDIAIATAKNWSVVSA